MCCTECVVLNVLHRNGSCYTAWSTQIVEEVVGRITERHGAGSVADTLAALVCAGPAGLSEPDLLALQRAGAGTGLGLGPTAWTSQSKPPPADGPGAAAGWPAGVTALVWARLRPNLLHWLLSPQSEVPWSRLSLRHRYVA